MFVLLFAMNVITLHFLVSSQINTDSLSQSLSRLRSHSWLTLFLRLEYLSLPVTTHVHLHRKDNGF